MSEYVVVISKLVVGSDEQDNIKEKLRGYFQFLPFEEIISKGDSHT